MRTLLLVTLFTSIAVLTASPVEAQIGERIKNRIKRDTERRIENRAVEAARRTLDLAEGAIVCVVTDQGCIEDAQKQGKEPVVVNEEGEPLPGYEPAGNAGAGSASGASGAVDGSGDDGAPGEGVWANYDFIPGDKVLYLHDMEGTRTGNFPSRLDYIAGNLEVVELGENKVLRAGDDAGGENGRGGTGCFSIPLPEALPERYTIEYRVRTSDPLLRATVELFSDASDDSPDTRCTYPPNPHMTVGGNFQGLQLPGGYGAGKAGVDQSLTADEWFDIRIAVDGPYWKMYVNEQRVANVPSYAFPRSNKLHVFMRVYRYSIYVDDLRIAEGGPRSLYDDLMAEGVIFTSAIRFDTGSARIKPESTGFLNEVFGMLEDHDDLNLLIEGHTDDVGSETSNQTLSEQRAQAVVAYLTRKGINAERLESAGFGESQPVADNATPEGRAMNRRVGFRPK